MLQRMTAIIGIDPSLTATGVAGWDGATWTIEYPKSCTGDKRLEQLWLEIGCELNDKTHVVMEDLPTHAHGAGLTGMVHGVIRLAIIQAHAQYITVPPATLKKFATGKGNATKADMRMALYRRADLDIRDDNQVDAWWLRELGLHLAGQPTFEVPASHTVALEKLQRWNADAH